MFKNLSLLTFLFWHLNLFANTDIKLGQWHQLDSEILAQTRPYSVYLPPSYIQSKDKQYPVMYVLDGDETKFKGISGLLGSMASNHKVSEYIIVAIPNMGGREKYFLPENKKFIFKGKLLEDFGDVGEADKFIQFLAQDLIPQIDKTYRSNDKRLIVGHSFAGLFSAYVLLSNPKLFSDYLIIDPTAVWDNNYLNRKYQELEYQKVNTTANVYISFANNLHLGELGRTNADWGREFAQRLAMHPTLKFKSRYFEHESHSTVAELSWYYGVKYLAIKNN